MHLSIIIPSYNSEKTIELCLKSILVQKTSINYEIIVVDSSPNNLVDNIVKKYSKIKFIKLKEKTYQGIARNIGASHSFGEVLAFVDSDVVVQNSWINKVLEYYKEGHSIFVGSIDIWSHKKINLIGKLEWFFSFSEFKPNLKESTKWCLPGYALIIKKDIFVNNNGFIKIPYWEDTEFTVRFNKAGNKLFFNPKIKVYHIFRNNFPKLIKKVNDFGCYHAQLRKMHNISGSSIIKNKILGFFVIPSFALVKFIKISWRNIKYNNLFDKLLYIFMFPLIILLVISWMVGFYKGLLTYKN